MGRVHEAVKRAEQEQKVNFPQPVPYVEKTLAPYSLPDQLMGTAPSWCQELWSKLKLNPSYSNMKSILFTGAGNGCGCTFAAAHFAVYVATNAQKKILLLDLKINGAGLGRFFNYGDSPSPAEILTTTSMQNSQIFHSLKKNLVVVSNDEEHSEEAATWLASENFEQFLEKARNQFDYILVDSAPFLLSYETKLLSAKADAVILVFESGQTRRSVAIKIKKDLEECGANIMGAIINKRKYYIPEWLYKRL
jgi:Mrp family chromosome partitioning ATPase